MNEQPLPLAILVNELEVFLKELIPEATTVQKYGGTLFTLKPEEKEGQFCGVFASSKHVKVSFGKGYLLEDPQGKLLGKGKYRRHINFASTADVDFDYLETLVRQAVNLP